MAMFLLLAACGSSGTSDETPQQPCSLERFATAKSLQVAFDPNGVLYATVLQQSLLNGDRIAELFSFSADGQPADRSLSITNPGGLASDGKALYFTETRTCVLHFCDSNASRLAADGTIAKIAVTNRDEVGPATLAGIAVDAAGNIYVADIQDGVVREVAPSGVAVQIGVPFVGNLGEADGSASLASFSGPSGLAVDAAGNLYVADRGGNTIRKITPDGNVTTIAGVTSVAGSLDGPAASATFNHPTALAVDAQGNLFVADTGNALIRRLSTSGDVTTFAGTRGLQGFMPGPLPGVLDAPTSIAIYGNDLYFAMPGAIGRVRNIPAE